MLELLRSRLTDLEARQRAAGGVAEAGFWERSAGRMPSPSSQQSPPTAGSAFTAGGEQAESAPRPVRAERPALTEPRERSEAGRPPKGGGRFARAGATARPVAPVSRPMAPPSGPWSDLAPEDIESLDLDNLPWLDEAAYEEMIDDPAWIESVSRRAEVRAGHDAGVGSQRAAVDAITLDAMAGLGLTTHGAADLVVAADRVAQQRRTHEVTLVTIVSELVSRGVETPEGLSRTDWLRSHDPSLTAGQARAFVTVGTALTVARWARLRLLVATQQVTVGNAAQIIDFDTRARPVADTDDLETALGDLTAQAPQLRPEELARLVRHHTEQIRPPRDEDRLDRGRREARGLWLSQPNPAGMVGMRGTLDPEAAAILKAAIDALSAPAPVTDEHGGIITHDDRTSARRRMDALLAIVQRGVASADGVPTTDRAKVVVLIDYDTLVDDFHESGSGSSSRWGSGSRMSSGSGSGSGQSTVSRMSTGSRMSRGSGQGSGTTLTGDVLSPGAVRRMACDAEIIPVVLGGDSEPLDVGRSRRLFTRSQRLALIARDKGCSYPGCTTPATWCDAHHVIHWCQGGRTGVANGACCARGTTPRSTTETSPPSSPRPA
ncbi:hypothetical protein GCM10009740_23550 [Terrabacter terrae]|uniref:DUF222 domain-containing protein n=2 Tax=Terrabacter terrae TaxID=318434 RepID=A0ABN2UBP9_9MICO